MWRSAILMVTALSISACEAPRSTGELDDAGKATRRSEPEIAKKAADPSPEPESTTPANTTTTPPSTSSDQGVVLAKLPGDPPKILRSGTPTTVAAIEAALPGFSVERRRLFGVDVVRNSKKVATVLEEVGKPFNRITLLGPGLSDPHGIEVGASISKLIGLPELTCAIEGDAEWGSFVACSAGEKPQIRYVFVKPLAAERMGETLTLNAAEQELGKTTLTAIEIANW